MGFFSGPSKYVVVRMAQGVASFAMQIHTLRDFDPDMRNQIMEKMRAEGAPTTMEDLIAAAASVVTEQNMGWLRKNQYLGTIQNTLVLMGMSASDAAYVKGLIELKVPRSN